MICVSSTCFSLSQNMFVYVYNYSKSIFTTYFFTITHPRMRKRTDCVVSSQLDDKRGLEGQSHLVTNFSDRDLTFMSNVKLGNNLNATPLKVVCVYPYLFIYY